MVVSSWAHDKHGQYTVKSAYNFARTANFFYSQGYAGKGANSDRAAEEKNWKALWSIQDLGKMKIVLWRIFHDCLPTGHQLTQRHIPADGQCVFCGHHERVEHLFGAYSIPSKVVSKILAYVDMINTYLCKPPKPEKKPVTSSVARWAPPPPGWVCIIVDAALFPNDRRMGCGAVLRDHRGGFILSISEGPFLLLNWLRRWRRDVL
jgi:hypothetical protein